MIQYLVEDLNTFRSNPANTSAIGNTLRLKPEHPNSNLIVTDLNETNKKIKPEQTETRFLFSDNSPSQ